MKTRNFFLALFGFLLLGILFYILMEVYLSMRREPPPLAMSPPTATPEPDPPGSAENPSWLLLMDTIQETCDSPWVITRALPALNHTFGDLRAAGLSDCYTVIGESAVASHLWHQGISLESVDGEVLDDQHLFGWEVTLYFEPDADFQALGMASPETHSLSGTVIHDLNGDAVFNPGEPVIPNVEICLNREILSPICVQSRLDGVYEFRDLVPGVWPFEIRGPEERGQEVYRYTNQLLERDHYIPERVVNGYTIAPRILNLTEFTPIDLEILVPVDQDRVQDFTLMQGWATSFAAPWDRHLFKTQAHLDQDLRPRATRIYNGDSGPTYDQHDGLDISCPVGTEIVSVAEGRVIAIFDGSTVAVRHNDQLVSIYGHGHPLVVLDQYIPRGYPVTRCDQVLTKAGPHLHFAVWRNNPWLPRVIYTIPAYADLVVPEQKWEANRNSLAPDYYIYVLQGGPGVWTETNRPHPSYVRLVGN